MVRYWLALLLLTIPSAAHAQTEPSGQGGRVTGKKVFTISVDLVQLDVTATDSDGRHVMDLKPEDFVILQDGKPREITSFSLIRVKEPGEYRTKYKPATLDKNAPATPAPPTACRAAGG